MRHALVPLLLSVSLSAQTTVTLVASQDNTLFEDPLGALSDGAGSGMFAGIAGTGLMHRALVQFPVAASVPRGAQIVAATLTLNMSRTIAPTYQVGAHRVTASWGEAGSTASRGGGGGGAALPGDATWLFRFYPGTPWASAGGEFVPAASASIPVGGVGRYSWSGAQMVADVQAWVCSPASNFGWVLVGDETTGPTAKRFDTRNHATAANRPQLTIRYLAPAAAVIPLGSGCQSVALAASGLPRLGNAAFALSLTGGASSGYGLLLLALDALAAPAPLGGGCSLYADPAWLVLAQLQPLDGSGAAGFALPIPADPSLNFGCAVAQALSFDAWLTTLAASAGQRLILGP